jgi:FKBP-type peptidyl-prolyl cis-trans isomerase
MFTFRHIICLLSVVLVSCGNSEKNQPVVYKVKKQAIKDQFIKANQQVVVKENDEMEFYARSHKMAFVNTDLGLRYYVYQASAKGDSIKDGDEITMEFTVSLLDGTECYSSKTEGPKTFKVGHENLESGIHKGVQFLKKGDKALIMIPSHLAHGLLGDMKNIPPQRAIIYDVQILNK